MPFATKAYILLIIMETDRIILRPMKKSILSIILAIAALTATAQNTYTLNFDPVLLSEELAKENVKIDSFYLRQ